MSVFERLVLLLNFIHRSWNWLCHWSAEIIHFTYSCRWFPMQILVLILIIAIEAVITKRVNTNYLRISVSIIKWVLEVSSFSFKCIDHLRIMAFLFHWCSDFPFLKFILHLYLSFPLVDYFQGPIIETLMSSLYCLLFLDYCYL